MKLLFVTVGSTMFADLTSKVLSPEFIKLLHELNFTHLRIQAGSTPVAPVSNDLINIHVYSYKSSIIEDMKDAFMIISHAGSGSILEALYLQKKLLVIVNESLMDNHQNELASELSPDYLLASNVSNLQTDFIKCHDSETKREWIGPQTTLLPILMQELNE